MTERIIIKTARVGTWGKDATPKINYAFNPTVRKGDKVRLINILKEKLAESPIKVRLDNNHIAYRKSFGYEISRG